MEELYDELDAGAHAEFVPGLVCLEIDFVVALGAEGAPLVVVVEARVFWMNSHKDKHKAKTSLLLQPHFEYIN